MYRYSSPPAVHLLQIVCRISTCGSQKDSTLIHATNDFALTTILLLPSHYVLLLVLQIRHEPYNLSFILGMLFEPIISYRSSQLKESGVLL